MKDKFLQTLNRIERGIPKIQEECRLIRHFYNMKNKGQAYDSCFRLAEIVEKTALLTRALPCYTGNPRAQEEMEKCIEENVPVEMGFTIEGWFSVRIPKLLPKKGYGDVNYIRGILWLAIRKFFEEKSVVRYENCVMIYRHVYGPQYNKRYMRDHDNIETYMISDMIAMYVLYDDCPYLCSNYDCTAEGEAERTEIYVVPQAEFTDWLKAEKTMPKEGIKLYETKLS